MEIDCNLFATLCLGKLAKTLIMVYSLSKIYFFGIFLLVFYRHFVYDKLRYLVLIWGSFNLKTSKSS